MKVLRAIKNFFMDWIWQLPQNLIGFGYKLFIYEDILDHLTNTSEHYTVYLKETDGGVTLGKYIFVYKKFNNLPYVVQHESGHVKQSKILGPLYLIIIGIPSLLWASTHRSLAPNKNYYWFYTEAWANKLAGIS